MVSFNKKTGAMRVYDYTSEGDACRLCPQNEVCDRAPFKECAVPCG